MIEFPIGNPTIEVVFGLLGFFGVLIMGMSNVVCNPPENMSGEEDKPNPIQYQVRFGWRKFEDG